MSELREAHHDDDYMRPKPKITRGRRAGAPAAPKRRAREPRPPVDHEAERLRHEAERRARMLPPWPESEPLPPEPRPRRRGLREAAEELLEVWVPVRPGGHGGHVIGNPNHDERGRFASHPDQRASWVEGHIHPELQPGLDHYLDAVREGNGHAMEERMAKLQAKAGKLRGHGGEPELSGRDTARQKRLLTRIHQRAIEPTGEQRPYGAPMNIGGHVMPMPRGAHEQRGLPGGWTSDGRFGWEIEPDSLGGHTDHIIAQLSKSHYFEVKRTRTGHVVTTSKKIDPAQQHLAALEAETFFNGLRTRRIVKPGDPMLDDRPLDLAPHHGSLPQDSEADMAAYSRHSGLDKAAIGAVGEATLTHAQEAVAELAPDVPALRPFVGEVVPYSLNAEIKGDEQPVMDMLMGKGAVECKAKPVRGMTNMTSVPGEKIGVSPETGRPVYEGGETAAITINPDQAAKKRAFLKEHGLARGALLEPLVDSDTGEVHLMMHVYKAGDSQAFKERRMPMAFKSALLAGQARPGDTFGKPDEPSVYLGTFAAPLNPHLMADRTPDLLGAHGEQARAKAVKARALAKPRRKVQAQFPAERVKSRDAEIIAAYSKGGVSQNELAKRFGLSQARIHAIIPAHLRKGKGKRSDREPSLAG